MNKALLSTIMITLTYGSGITYANASTSDTNIIFYEDTHYNGTAFSLPLTGDMEIRRAEAIVSNSSSVKIPPGYYLEAYTKPDYDGYKMIFSQSNDSFTWYINLNDNIHSYKVGSSGITVGDFSQSFAH